MLKEVINYVDYNGVERSESYYFNLTKAEVVEMEMSTEGGLVEMINKIIEAKDAPAIIAVFKELILKAYGEKSPDGKRFNKIGPNGEKLSIAFSQTEAYSELFMKLATDAEAAKNFVNGIIPSVENK